MALDKAHAARLGVLFVYFIALAFLLWNYDISGIILPLLVLSAIIWFGYEYSKGIKKKDLNAAFEIGLFLMLFDFAIENVGAILDLWQVTSALVHVVYVPFEVMLLALIGGMAWALAQPKGFSRVDSAVDILLFSVFGTVGEYLLIKNSIMYYAGGWTSLHAFLGYFITFCILHYLKYRVVPFFRFK